MKNRTAIMTVAALLSVVPAPAYAATLETTVTPGWPSYVIGILSLLAAAFLLVDAVLLQRVAQGGAIAENISFMVLGVVCLAASVLVKWILGLLSSDVSLPQVTLASDALVLLSMVLLGLYFWRVRSVLAGYLKTAKAYASAATTPAEELSAAPAAESVTDSTAGEGDTRV